MMGRVENLLHMDNLDVDQNYIGVVVHGFIRSSCIEVDRCLMRSHSFGLKHSDSQQQRVIMGSLTRTDCFVQARQLGKELRPWLSRFDGLRRFCGI